MFFRTDMVEFYTTTEEGREIARDFVEMLIEANFFEVAPTYTYGFETGIAVGIAMVIGITLIIGLTVAGIFGIKRFRKNRIAKWLL